MLQKLINSQLSNFKTYLMHRRQLITLAKIIIQLLNLPKSINLDYVYTKLVYDGSIAFFHDEIMGMLALPYIPILFDVYGEPTKIEVIGQNGYRRILRKDEFVIMYDNTGRYSIITDLKQYAERLALDDRTCDLNIAQQKTPRVWKTSSEKLKSVKDLVNNIDTNIETVISYEGLDLDELQIVLSPAPYVADKVTEHKEKIWNEAMRLIGVPNMNFQKKERNIKDEVIMSQGGTIASKFSRFEPRKSAVEEINEKFKKYLEKPIEVAYFDKLPTTEKEENEEVEIND